MSQLLPHPDRFLPPETTELSIARRIYAEVETKPIYSPHGHVSAALLAENSRFPDPAALLITPDHYVTRLLHASGVSLARLGLSRDGQPSTVSGREIWREFCSRWDLFLGTPVRAWFESELSQVFGLTKQPSSADADSLYDQIDDALGTDEFLPRALLERFDIHVLATTDDPADNLAAHRTLRDDDSVRTHILPTFRADRYMLADHPDWAKSLAELASAAQIDCGTYAGLLAALRHQRAFFRSLGATATDSGVADAGCEPLSDAAAERLHRKALNHTITPDEAISYRHNMLYRFAEMSSEDGLVMQLHPGVIRNHHQPTFASYGPDTGHDLPDNGSFSRPLIPILRDFGTNPQFRVVLFSVDETVFSREIAPLAGFYPSVFAGAPWWFLDAPSAMRRYREAVTETIGFSKTSGFIDDTRAFCSIPARHDMARRVDAAYLASLVAEHRISEEDAIATALDLVTERPIDTFRLPR